MLGKEAGTSAGLRLADNDQLVSDRGTNGFCRSHNYRLYNFFGSSSLSERRPASEEYLAIYTLNWRCCINIALPTQDWF